MSLLGGVFGRRGKPQAKLDGLFALLTCLPDLEAQGLTPAGGLGLCVRVSEEPAFDQAVAETQATAELYAREHPVTLTTTEDGLGFRWWTVRAPGFDDAVTAVHLLADELTSRGYGVNLLAVLVPMHQAGHGPWYLVYNYRRGTYYPFVPRPDRQRDTAREMSLSASFPRTLPAERDLDRWYALWDPPLAADPAPPQDS